MKYQNEKSKLNGSEYKTIKEIGREIKKEWIRKENIPPDLLNGGIKGKGILYPPETVEKIKKYFLDFDKSEKYVKTCERKYGVNNVSKLDDIQKKKENTMLKHFGTSKSFELPQTKETIIKKYGVDNVSKSDEIKNRKEKTCIKNHGVKYGVITDKCHNEFTNKYGVSNAYLIPYVRAKAKSERIKKYYYDNNWFDSSWELSYYFYLKKNNIDFTYQPKEIFKYYFDNYEHEYWPDFKVGDEFVEIKGDQFFKNGEMINPFDEKMNGLFEAKHQCMIKNNVKIITEKDINFFIEYAKKELGDLKEFRKSKESNVIIDDEYVEEIFNTLPKEFPYPSLKDDDFSLIKFFHKSIYSSNVKNKLSPVNAWKNEELLKKVIKNRMQYKNPPYTADMIREGFNISKIAPRVSLFNPEFAEYLIKKYLSNSETIVDPFSGFSGRMIGSYRSGKKYIGFDINKEHINESNEIIKYLNISQFAEMFCQDILTSDTKTFHNASLLTCPPYNDKEKWGDEIVTKKCDDWIDICIEKYKCDKYLFVIDKTEKYKNFIVEKIVHKTYFATSSELVIFIDKV